MSKSILPMFSSRSFIISALMFRSLFHFEFMFVYDVRECFNFILLYVPVQFSQHHLLKRLSVFHCIFLSPLSKINWPYMCIYFWTLYYVPLIYVSVFVPVLYYFDYDSFVVFLKSEGAICPTLLFFLNIITTIWGHLCFIYIS